MNKNSLSVICFVTCVVASGCAEIREEAMLRNMEAIDCGRGTEGLLGGQDRFARHLRYIDDDDTRIREDAAQFLSTHVGSPCGCYALLINAYFDAGKGGDAIAALERGLKRSPPELDNHERKAFRRAFIEAKVMAYGWDRPELLKSMGWVQRPSENPRRVYWGYFGVFDHPDVIEQMIAEGDKAVEGAWIEEIEYMNRVLDPSLPRFGRRPLHPVSRAITQP